MDFISFEQPSLQKFPITFHFTNELVTASSITSDVTEQIIFNL